MICYSYCEIFIFKFTVIIDEMVLGCHP